jgi:biopolymer transport protein ExbB
MDSIGLRGKTWFLLAVVLCATLVVVAAPQQSVAQGDQPPADVQKQAPPEGTLHWLIRCSAWIGLVILVLSVYFVATVGRLFWEMRMEVAAPPGLVAQCDDLLEKRDFKGVYGALQADESFYGRLLTTGIAELPNGLVEAREAMERVGDAITAEMERKISMLAVLGQLGPMIGLLGTLKGMITSFSAIAQSGAGQLDTAKVGTGISEALLLTFEGVALSLPAIYFFALFRNRVVAIATSVMLSGDQFLRHFSHAGRAKASAAAPPSKPTK